MNVLLWLKSPSFPRVLPFAVFMSFIAVTEIGDMTGLLPSTNENLALLYPVKALCTAIALLWALPRCSEIRWADLANIKNTALSLVVGLVVFVLWIHMDWSWSALGEPVVFDPNAAGDGHIRTAFLACRFLGAVAIVPLIEELFWRSWLLRILESSDFEKVSLTHFSYFSFFAVNALFALEHYLILAGFMAGIAYTVLMQRTNSVTQAVLAHAVTNAALSIWVLYTGNWAFW